MLDNELTFDDFISIDQALMMQDPIRVVSVLAQLLWHNFLSLGIDFLQLLQPIPNAINASFVKPFVDQILVDFSKTDVVVGDRTSHKRWYNVEIKWKIRMLEMSKMEVLINKGLSWYKSWVFSAQRT